MSGKLEGKVAIITGGNSGIGATTAHLFAKEGAKVALMARREEQGKEVEESIRSEGGDATYIQCDVSVTSSANAAVDDIMIAEKKAAKRNYYEAYKRYSWARSSLKSAIQWVSRGDVKDAMNAQEKLERVEASMREMKDKANPEQRKQIQRWEAL